MRSLNESLLYMIRFELILLIALKQLISRHVMKKALIFNENQRVK